MTGYVAFLRGINVGGKHMIPMADLRAMASGMGFEGVQTLLQSGNLVFKASGQASDLQARLQEETQKRFGFAIEYVVRTASDLDDVIAGNPFPDEAKTDRSHLLVLFANSPVDPLNFEPLQKAIVGREVVKGGGRCAYAVYPDGIGNSKLTINVIEKHLKCRVTGRNWNTVLKLASLLQRG